MFSFQLCRGIETRRELSFFLDFLGLLFFFFLLIDPLPLPLSLALSLLIPLSHALFVSLSLVAGCLSVSLSDLSAHVFPTMLVLYARLSLFRRRLPVQQWGTTFLKALFFEFSPQHTDYLEAAANQPLVSHRNSFYSSYHPGHLR